MPKSGSTFLSHALANLLGYKHGYAAYSYVNIEQELYLPRLIDVFGRRIVLQQHFKANQANLGLLDEFGARPIVQIRNVLDVLVSLREHLMVEPLNSIPGLYPPMTFRDLAERQQYDFLVEYATPWLVSYYASWQQAAESGAWSDPLWVSYESARQDWASTLRTILEHQGIEVHDDAIEATLAELADQRDFRTRLNVGITGRGKTALTTSQRARACDIAGRYAAIDMKPIGLDSDASSDR